MKSSFELIQSISLGYRLGHPGFTPDKNQALYGVHSGREVRGQNLKIKVQWESLSASELLKNKAELKQVLSVWDHSFLNDRPEFKAQPVTLENFCRVLSEALSHHWGSAWKRLEVTQGKWSCEIRSDDGFRLSYSLNFQSLWQNHPLDLEMKVWWQGIFLEESGLLFPWTHLKADLKTAESSLDLETLQKTESVEDFLSQIVKVLSRTFPALDEVSFYDPLNQVAWSFYSSENFS